ncbi:MAG: DegV family protein [Christensenellales bacterium]
MGNCKIFTNSVSDLSPERARQYNIGVVADIVIFQDKEYQCNVDIDPPKLFAMMRESRRLPSTSHPNEYIYANSFRSAQAYDEILCINVSSVMSGSYQTACSCAKTLAEEGFKPRIYTYDSLQVSFGLTILVIEAAKLAAEGKTAGEIIQYLDTIRDRVAVYFVMRSLENAKRGGRVGEIKCLTAGLLGIHPMLTFRDGTVKEVRLMHTFDKALLRVAECYCKLARKGSMVFVYHADNEPDALRIKQYILDFDPEADVHIDWIGVAIGIYTGEGTVGIAFLA